MPVPHHLWYQLSPANKEIVVHHINAVMRQNDRPPIVARITDVALVYILGLLVILPEDPLELAVVFGAGLSLTLITRPLINRALNTLRDQIEITRQRYFTRTI